MTAVLPVRRPGAAHPLPPAGDIRSAYDRFAGPARRTLGLLAPWLVRGVVGLALAVFVFLAGGPSHLELFDNKPTLARMHGQPMPASVTRGQPIAQLQGAQLTCFGPQWGFKKHGRGGVEMNELFTHLPQVADDLCAGLAQLATWVDGAVTTMLGVDDIAAAEFRGLPR